MKDKETVKIASRVKNGWQTTEGFRVMLAVALLFDLLSAIPWIGMIFSGLGYASLWVWLEMRGVKVSLFTGDTKKLASVAAETVAGAVGLGIVPFIVTWTFFVVAEHKGKLAEKRQREQDAIKKAVKKTPRNSKVAGRIGQPKTPKRQKQSAYMNDTGDWTGKKAA